MKVTGSAYISGAEVKVTQIGLFRRTVKIEIFDEGVFQETFNMRPGDKLSLLLNLDMQQRKD